MDKINFRCHNKTIYIIVSLLAVIAVVLGFANHNSAVAYSYEVGDIAQEWTDIGISDGDITATLEVIEVAEDLTPSYRLNLDGEGNFADRSAASEYPWYDFRTMITEIKISSSIYDIGTQAFQGMSALENVDFGENSQIAVIGNDAFYGCSALEEIEIPSTVTTIGNSVFSNCFNLLNVKIADGSVLETVGSTAFARCTSLETINIPDSVKTIGLQAFYNCSSLSDVGITSASALESVGAQLFDGCKSLKNIVIPINLEKIENKMFNGAANLENVTIASNAKLNEIGSYAFAGCTSLLNINIPDTVENIGESAFFSCSSLTDVNINDESLITEICNSVFENCEALKTINLPSGLLYIDDKAFKNCYVIDNIEFNDKLEIIGEYAFEGCWKLSKAILPDSVTCISKYAFNKCKALGEVKLPNGLETLEEYTFANCTTLESIEIPESVTFISNRVFSDSGKLESVTLPSKLEYIGERAFNNCSSLNGIAIPNSVTYMGSAAFYGCKALKEINIPDGITSIEDSMFYNCSSLKSLEIPNNISSVGANAIANCSALEDVIVHISRGEGIKFTGQVFYPTEALAANRIVYVLDNADAEGYTLEGVTFGNVSLKQNEDGAYVHDTKPFNVTVKSNYKPNAPTAYIDSVEVEDGEKYSYNESKLVTIKKAEGTESSFIYYTLDGSVPTESNGIKYEEPFLIDKTSTLKFRSLEIGCISSQIISADIAISRTLTFDYATNGGGSVTKENQTVQYTDVVSLDITKEDVPVAKKDGYEFIGWNTDKTAHTVLTSVTNFADDTTVYAIYKKTITAVFRNSAKDEIKSVDFYNTEDITKASIKSPSISKKSGWTSKGWRFAKNVEYGDDEPRPEIYSVGGVVPIRDGDMFEVVYTKDIKLVYNLNGSGAVSDIENEVCTLSSYTITEGIDRSIAYFTVTDKTPTRSGYFFTGWGGTAAATEEAYYPGDTIPTGALEENFNIYAIWSQKSYTLTETSVSGSFDDLSYGYQTSNSVVYTIVNAGNSDVTNLKASIKTSAFTLSPLSRTALPPGEKATITVTFPMNMNAGTYSDVLTITGDNVREPLGINFEQKVIPRPISIKSVAIADKVYDGEVLATVEDIQFGGIDGYEFSVSDYIVKAEFEDPNVAFDADSGEEIEKNVRVTVNLKKNNFVFDFNEYSAKAKILRAEVPSTPDDSITAKCSHNNLSQTTDLLPEGWTWKSFSSITSGEKYTAVYKDANNYNNSTKDVTVYISTQHTYTDEITTKPTCVTYGVRTYTCECGASYTEPVEKDASNHINTSSVVKTPSNCVEKGVMEYTCNDCGAVYEGEIEINSSTHKGYVGTKIKEATCQQTGLMRYKCYCGDYYDVVIEKNYDKHEYVTTIIKTPTCNETGYANFDCPCGNHYSSEIGKDLNNHTGYVGVETVKPTCQKKGEMTYTCSGCGDKYTEPIAEDPTYHADYSWEDTVPATCQSTGLRTYTCICGDTYDTVTDKNPNNHVDYTSEVLEKATCKKTGVIRYTCACGYYYDDVIPIDYNAHKYIPEIIEEATCADSGRMKYTCSACGYSYIGEYAKDPTKHTTYSSSVTKEPNCQSEGVMTYTCEGCGHQYTESIAKNPDNHVNLSSTITKLATCNEEGERLYTCACGEYSYTESLPINQQNHKYPITYTTVKSATCTTSGERLCTYACGHSYTEEIPVNLSNHTYEGVVEVEPTCQAQGVMRYTCRGCGRTYTEKISKNPNKHVDYSSEVVKTANCSEYGEIKHTCLCGYSYIEEVEKNPEVHSQLVTRVDKVPNCCEEGERVVKCSGCGYTETEPIEIDPENHKNHVETVILPSTCSATGTMQHTCEGCGANYTTVISIDPFNHKYKNGICEYCGLVEEDVVFSKVKAEYDGTNYIWDYKVKVKEGVAQAPKVIFAAYGMDNSLVGISIVDIEPTELAVDISGVTECSKPAKSYKIYLWDFTEQIRPLTAITK